MSEQHTIPDEVMADLDALADALDAGETPAPELVRRVRERAERIRADIRQQHGLLDIAVPCVRADRDRDDR